MGDAVKAAEEPDWDRVKNLAEALLGRSKDLRVAVHLSTAWTAHRRACPAWPAAWPWCAGLLETYWDGVHPAARCRGRRRPDRAGQRRGAAGRSAQRAGLFPHHAVRAIDAAGPFLAARSAHRQRQPEDGRQRGRRRLPTMTDIEACCMDCPDERARRRRCRRCGADSGACQGDRRHLQRTRRHRRPGAEGAAVGQLRAEEIHRDAGRAVARRPMHPQARTAVVRKSKAAAAGSVGSRLAIRRSHPERRGRAPPAR